MTDIMPENRDGEAALQPRKRHKTYGGSRTTPGQEATLLNEQTHTNFLGVFPGATFDIAAADEEKLRIQCVPSTRDTELLTMEDLGAITIEGHSLATVNPRLLTNNQSVEVGGGKTSDSEAQSRQSRRLTTEGFTEGSSGISTTRSSMGGYETLNIDLRGNGLPADVISNPLADGLESSKSPFGQLEISGRSKEYRSITPAKSLDKPSVNDELDVRSRQRSKSVMTSVESTVSTVPLLSPDSKSKSEKLLSRRTPSSLSASSHPLFSLSEPEFLSQHSAEEQNKKKGKQGRKRTAQPEFSASLELASDELAIGLPKEQYRPRPSRSRGSTVDASHIVDSPEKVLTSEVNLSDEAVIGLPKEQYKPRPSRSRGNPGELLASLDSEPKPKKESNRKVKQAKKDTKAVDTDEEAEPIRSIQEPVKQMPEESAEQNTHAIIPDVEAGLAVTIESLAHVDEDVQDGPSDISMHEMHDGVAAAVARSVDDQSKEQTFTIEVPPAPQPKKRGRKRKLKATGTVLAEDDTKTPQAPHKTEAQPEVVTEDERPPLHSKDANVANFGIGNSKHDLDEEGDNGVAKAAGLEEPDAPVRATESSALETPNKQAADPSDRGPARHSPLGSGKVPHRVGLSRRAPIQSLLKIVRK